LKGHTGMTPAVIRAPKISITVPMEKRKMASKIDLVGN